MPDERRTHLFPIRYQGIYERYKQHLSGIWVAGEVDLSSDRADWERLTPEERHFVSHVLAFFASADGIVCDNLLERFGREVQVREARLFYDLQRFIENIHSEMYSLLIDTYVKDSVERTKLFHAVEHVPCVAAKAAWAEKWLRAEASFATRLIAFAIVEGVFFSGSFCAIFWLKKRGLMPGLCVSNTLIARDEGLHQEFATYLYAQELEERVPTEKIHEMMAEAVDLETGFCCDALPCSLVGMSAEDMATYIRFVSDRLLLELKVEPLYRVKNPFEWMDLISLENKTNFFEQRVSEYQKVGARPMEGMHTFSMEDDF